MNKQTTIFEGDVYVKTSEDPDIYGIGNLYIDGAINYSSSNALTINITSTTDATNSSTGGALTDFGGASIAKSLYVGKNLNVNSVNMTPSIGDIFSENTFYAANNQIIPANIEGFNIVNTVRYFQAIISVTILANNNIVAGYTLEGIQLDNLGTWSLNSRFIGQNINMVFNITNTGQIQYTSINIPGFISSTIKFRATTTSI